jgi:serine/threonine protein phosphatase PrpC
MRVREGDLLLLATDGVYDNLFEEEILGIVSKLTRNGEKTAASAHNLSQVIAETAFTRSKKVHVKTPFSIKKA